MNWEGNPYEAGPLDPDGFRLEPMRALAVMAGVKRLRAVTITDERLRVVAAIAEAYRAGGLTPTPDRIVVMLERLQYPTRGALRWITDLMRSNDADRAARRRVS